MTLCTEGGETNTSRAEQRPQYTQEVVTLAGYIYYQEILQTNILTCRPVQMLAIINT